MTKKVGKKDAPKIGYKGLDKDFKCRGFQYEVGKTYTHGGEAKLCSSGFHYVENPLDAWDYYPLGDNRYAEVEAEGVSPETESDTKRVAAKLTIKKEMKVADMVAASVAFVFSFCFKSSGKVEGEKPTKDAPNKKIGSSGYSAQIGSSGDSAKIGSSGDYAKIDSTGERSIASGIGENSTAKAKEGSWIVLAEWKNIDGKYTPVCVRAGQVGKDGLKADTWYRLTDGKFEEVK